MAVQRHERSAFIDVEFGNAGRSGKRSLVTRHRFGWAVEPSQKTTAFVQRVNVVRLKRKNRFVGGQCLIKPLQTLERAGSISKRGKIVRAKRERVLKVPKRLLMTLERGQDEAIVVEQLRRARSTREDRTNELQRLNVTSLLVVNETEQILCVALTRLAHKNVAKNALGVGQLSALPQSQRLLDRAERSRGCGGHRLPWAHSRRAPRRATPINS